MEKNSDSYRKCIRILQEELIPAMGCTEPIAIAYCAAIAADALGTVPERVLVEASGNMIKNVKSVTVPNTGGLHGIPAAAAAGIVAGDAKKQLEVISEVCEAQKQEIGRFLEQIPITVELLKGGALFDLIVTLYRGGSYAQARIAGHHTNLVHLERDGQVLLEKEYSVASSEAGLTDRSFLTMDLIYDFAESADPEEVRVLLDRQIRYNMAIAREGLTGNYGANVGRTYDTHHRGSVYSRCIALAAAGSDARMSGCELPVIINSGSGNQGITCSVPVIVYGESCGASEEMLLRALLVSNLTAIYQKRDIGRLSAFCGAINAGAAAGCGIAYLKHHKLSVIRHTLVNALAISSGIVCDGAKASCAGKIAIAVETGILGMELYEDGRQFYGGDGIIKKGVDNTVHNVGRLGRDGMRQTDEEILHIMLDR